MLWIEMQIVLDVILITFVTYTFVFMSYALGCFFASSSKVIKVYNSHNFLYLFITLYG